MTHTKHDSREGSATHRPGGGSAHPLLGANTRTLLALLRRHGVRPGDRIGVMLGAIASSVARAPVSLCERGLVAAKTPHGAPAPLFILGHWRSGTTHLYNIISKSGDFAYVPPLATGLPWDMLTLGRALRPWLERMLPGERFIDKIPVKPDSPQEDEAALANMQPVSFYHGLYFPRRLREEVERGVFFDGLCASEIALWERRFLRFVDKIRILQPGRRVVIKNPVYTARVAAMDRLCPGSLFVHIARDPRDVFFSMRGFYSKLLEAYALQPYSLEGVDELIFSVYERMADSLYADAATLPAGRFIEIRYDDLTSAPIECLRAIGGRLGLDEEIERGVPAFREYLESVRKYEKNRHDRPAADVEMVERRLARHIERYEARRAGAVNNVATCVTA